MTVTHRTDVAIIGAGPAGLLLAHLLAARGVDTIVLEHRRREHVEARVRAGILEQGAVEVLQEAGLAERLLAEGTPHHGIHLHWPDQRHRIDFADLTGRCVWLYGQTEVQRDLHAAADAAGRTVHYEVDEVALHDLLTDRPSVTWTDAHGQHRVETRALAGCDGSFGPSRSAVPAAATQTWERVYPHSWLGILADVAPSTDELIYARHPDGFALHSMRSDSVSRLYLQVPNGTAVEQWSDDRIWDALAARLGHGHDGWELQPGPITGKSVIGMRSFVQAPMAYGRLFLAGDAAHIVPPTGAKGLNLAIADVALLAEALGDLVTRDDARAALAYPDRAAQRVWRATHFSWWMTSMLHATGDPFDEQLQSSQLRWVAESRAAATGLAENYVGRPITG